MNPIQLWLPAFGRSLGFADAAADMTRALAAWDCDQAVWILPGLEKGLIRWAERRGESRVQMCAVPGEGLECIEVLHVGQNGYVVGPGNGEYFPGGRVDGLLDAWLGWVETANFEWVPPPRIELQVPKVIGSEVEYRLQVFDSPSLPVRKRGVLARGRKAGDRHSATDAEVAALHRERYGELYRAKDKRGRTVLLSAADPAFTAVPGVLRPPEALSRLFGRGITLDGLAACTEMACIARLSRRDPDAALARATTKSAPYVSAGVSNLAMAWFMPAFVELGNVDHVIQRGETVGLTDVRDFKTLSKSQAWRKLMTRPARVTRAWGPIGLFWVLLLQRLELTAMVGSCELCGRAVKGTNAKRFCSRTESEECFLRRRANERRRERALKRAREQGG